MLSPKKTFITALFFSCATQADNIQPEALHSIPSQITLDYLYIQPTQHDVVDMGMLGIHYELNLLPIRDFYTGLGMYGAITGSTGGFFAFGLNNDYRPQLYRSLYLDSGFFVGGGGAHSSQVGGGLMLLPHLGLGYQIGAQRINLNYSYVTFPSGQISGNQVMVSLVLPGNFEFFSPTHNAGTNDTFDWQNDRLYLTPIFQLYEQQSPQHETFGLIGAEGGKFFTDRFYAALRATAIAHGNSGNGFMTVMGGVGYQLPLTQHLFFINDVFAGSGGGGQVDTGNGILLEADTGVAWQQGNFTPTLTAGYLTAPDGHFTSVVATAGVRYNLGWLSAPPHAHYYAAENDIQHWRAAFFNQTYFNPQRQYSETGNINLLGGSLEQQLNSNWYLSYRTAFAYQGDHTGGLASGNIGAGYQFNTSPHIHPHAEMLLGAVGGGSVDVGGGLFVQPELGLRFQLTHDYGIDAAVGRMISTAGHFNVTVLNVGGTFSFGKLQG